MRQLFVQIHTAKLGEKPGYPFKISLHFLDGVKSFYGKDIEKTAAWLAKIYSLLNNPDIAQLN